MTRNKQKKDPVAFLLDIIIVVMVFIILIVGCYWWFYRSLAKKSETFMQSADMLSFDLQNNDYSSLIQGKYINEFNGETKSKQYYALADYTEAISLYKVYTEKGNTEKAQAQEKIMLDARDQMGSLTVFADQLDNMFDF